MSNPSTSVPLTLTLYISFSTTGKLQISPSLNSDDVAIANLASDWLNKLETATSTQRSRQFPDQSDRTALRDLTEAAKWVRFVMRRYDLQSTMSIFEIPVLPDMGSESHHAPSPGSAFVGCKAIHGGEDGSGIDGSRRDSGTGTGPTGGKSRRPSWLHVKGGVFHRR
jgi:hypothetical protein